LLRAFGLADSADLAETIEGLNERLAMPANLTEMGVPEAVLDDMAAAAVIDHSTASNPRPAAQTDYAALFAAAM